MSESPREGTPAARAATISAAGWIVLTAPADWPA